ncbi:MAG: adenosine deaminase [Bacilli bacterium]|nr:adenosine deaminase [Bacilli bacterium]
MDIKKIKKVELHVHLDGSLNINTISDILKIEKDEIKNKLIADKKCRDLNDYLQVFDLPIKVMQTKESLIRTSKDLIESFINDNVIYAEVRFAPNKHTTILTLDEIITSVLEGIKSLKVKVKLILCMMRGDDFSDNKKIIDLAYKYKDDGVVGIDLAGAEGLYKTSDYLPLFKYASSLNIPFTIHAGEADGIESINAAISAGATRIGHGVRAIESKECINKLKEKNILLEICPTSNIQTGIAPSMELHPIKKLYDSGVKVSINTDNRTVSNVTLNEEYEILVKAFDFTEEDFNRMNAEAIKHSFLSDRDKQELINILKEAS